MRLFQKNVMLRLIVDDAFKRNEKQRPEALEFSFDMKKDIPVDVAKEMVSSTNRSVDSIWNHLLALRLPIV